MTHRNGLLLAALGVGAFAALLLPGPAAHGKDAVDEAIERFEEYLDTKPDSQGKRNAIAELALKKDPRVAKALTNILLRDPDMDVRIAVAQNIGKQNEPKMAMYLMKLAEDKKNRDHPKFVAACVEGVGDCDAKRHYKFLIDTLKKQMDYSGDIAGAAARALGNHPDPETVDDLVSQLVRADYVTTADNAQKKAARAAAKTVIIESLKKITKLDISDVKVWNDWWNDNKKSWKPPSAEDENKDINASETFEDEAYGFAITKPSRAWSFRKAEGDRLVIIEALDEGQRAAWVEVAARGTKNLASKTPDAMATEQKDSFLAQFRDIREEKWDKPIRISGEKGVEQVVFGNHKDHGAVWMHNVYVEKNQVMYLVYSFYKSGKSEALKDDIQKLIDSIKLTR